MTRIITFLLIAGTSAAVQAAAASDTHNALTTGYGPPVDQDWGIHAIASDAHNPLTTGYGPPVDQDWGIDSEPNNTHNPLTTGYGPPVK